MMRTLILIKHASPQVIPGTPPETWKLSDQGRQACQRLAEALRAHAPGVIVSSVEPKAVETGEIVAKALQIPSHTAPGLHEHDRSNVPHMRSSEFISLMELFFRRPGELVLGEETANAAQNRFEQALKAVLDQYASTDTVAIVSHGTVIAILLAKYSQKSAFHLWREWGLPSFAVVKIPEFEIGDMVPRI
jgi:broad specificity phosphatase PhoE